MCKLSGLKETVKTYFDHEWTKEERILVALNCLLAGIILGALWSPKRKKSSVMGSYNSGNGCGTVPEKEEKEEPEI